MDQLKALYSAGEYDAAWTRYRERPGRDPAWHLYGALAAWRRGDPGRGKDVADLALYNGAQGALRIRCLYVSGICHREYGDFRVALERIDECLRLLPEHPDLLPLLCGPCLYTKALALQSWGNPAEAVAVYEEALKEFRRERMDEYLRMALQNIAWTATELGRFPLAVAALEETEPLCHTDDTRRRQKVTQALLMGRTGEEQAALSLCVEIEKDSGSPIDIRSLACSVSAEIALRLGKTELAYTMAQHAVALALKDKRDGRCLLRASKVMSEIQRAKLGTRA